MAVTTDSLDTQIRSSAGRAVANIDRLADSLKRQRNTAFSKPGGSDFHGRNKPHISLGSGTGELDVPYEYLEELKKQV